MASSGTTFLVEFPGQYRNQDAERECVRDRFNNWSIDGRPMPTPKEVAKGIYIRLICAPQSVVDGMKRK
jgi:hypothetical protein